MGASASGLGIILNDANHASAHFRLDKQIKGSPFGANDRTSSFPVVDEYITQASSRLSSHGMGLEAILAAVDYGSFRVAAFLCAERRELRIPSSKRSVFHEAPISKLSLGDSKQLYEAFSHVARHKRCDKFLECGFGFKVVVPAGCTPQLLPNFQTIVWSYALTSSRHGSVYPGTPRLPLVAAGTGRRRLRLNLATENFRGASIVLGANTTFVAALNAIY
jgi:hypothetical protein